MVHGSWQKKLTLVHSSWFTAVKISAGYSALVNNDGLTHCRHPTMNHELSTMTN